MEEGQNLLYCHANPYNGKEYVELGTYNFEIVKDLHISGYNSKK
jgi:hypothetical protein